MNGKKILILMIILTSILIINNVHAYYSNPCANVKEGDFVMCTASNGCTGYCSNGVCNAYSHKECSGNSCVTVCVSGSDSCSSDVECGAECNNGATQTQSCGRCNSGTQTRTCSNGQWGSWSECRGEKGCVPGSTESCNCPDGASGTKTCNSNCEWGQCKCNYECDDGQTRSCTSNGCTGTQRCVNHHWGSCVAPRHKKCSGNSCVWECGSGSDSCTSDDECGKTNTCSENGGYCSPEPADGRCTKSIYGKCPHNEFCVKDNPVVCGDGYCCGNENKDNCCADCGCEKGYECVNGKCSSECVTGCATAGPGECSSTADHWRCVCTGAGCGGDPNAYEECHGVQDNNCCSQGKVHCSNNGACVTDPVCCTDPDNCGSCKATCMDADPSGGCPEGYKSSSGSCELNQVCCVCDMSNCGDEGEKCCVCGCKDDLSCVGGICKKPGSCVENGGSCSSDSDCCDGICDRKQHICVASGHCGDGTCDPNVGENCNTCEQDCKCSDEEEDKCAGTDTSCGIYPDCANCNSQDGCYETEYRDYYCAGTSCSYKSYPNDDRCKKSCSCTSWTNGGCGAGGCASNQMYQTRTCTPSGCKSEKQCVVDSSCQPSCVYGSWTNDKCGGDSCSSTQMHQTRNLISGDPNTCTDTSRCVSDSSCQPSCVYGSWTNKGCGAGGCQSTQMHQTRNLISGDPNTCTDTSRCVSDSSCSNTLKIIITDPKQGQKFLYGGSWIPIEIKWNVEGNENFDHFIIEYKCGNNDWKVINDCVPKSSRKYIWNANDIGNCVIKISADDSSCELDNQNQNNNIDRNIEILNI